MIDLHKLYVFHVVAQEGSFSAAAERLYITQSAVSQHIKDLEASLGQTLFDRGWHGARLTVSGQVLADYAQQVFALVAEAENALTSVGALSAGKVSLGATPGVGVYLAPRWVQQFRSQYPKLTVAVSTGVTAQIVSEVLAHRIDLGVIEGEPDTRSPARLASLVLDQVEQRVVVGLKHAFSDRVSVTLSDLNRRSFVVRQQNSQSRIWLEQALKQHGIEPMIGAEFDNLESMKRALSAGMCLAVLPPYVVETEVEQHLLHSIPVEGTPLVRAMNLVWDREVRFSPIARAFLGYLGTQYPAVKAMLEQTPVSP